MTDLELYIKQERNFQKRMQEKLEMWEYAFPNRCPLRKEIISNAEVKNLVIDLKGYVDD